jgi:hypothetical protein
MKLYLFLKPRCSLTQLGAPSVNFVILGNDRCGRLLVEEPEINQRAPSERELEHGGLYTPCKSSHIKHLVALEVGYAYPFFPFDCRFGYPWLETVCLQGRTLCPRGRNENLRCMTDHESFRAFLLRNSFLEQIYPTPEVVQEPTAKCNSHHERQRSWMHVPHDHTHVKFTSSCYGQGTVRSEVNDNKNVFTLW